MMISKVDVCAFSISEDGGVKRGDAFYIVWMRRKFRDAGCKSHGSTRSVSFMDIQFYDFITNKTSKSKPFNDFTNKFYK